MPCIPETKITKITIIVEAFPPYCLVMAIWFSGGPAGIKITVSHQLIKTVARIMREFHSAETLKATYHHGLALLIPIDSECSKASRGNSGYYFGRSSRLNLDTWRDSKCCLTLTANIVIPGTRASQLEKVCPEIPHLFSYKNMPKITGDLRKKMP